MDNQILTPRTRLDDWNQTVNFFYGTLASLTAKKIYVKGTKTTGSVGTHESYELPVYHLPYGEIYIGHNPPTPRERGFDGETEDVE